MKAFVIGCGRWGSFIAWYLNKIGHTVTLYGRPGSKRLQTLQSKRTNGLVSLDCSIQITDQLAEATYADIIIISINSQGLSSLIGTLAQQNLSQKDIVLCMKGLEVATGKRLSEIAEKNGAKHVAVWLGPGHVQEFLSGIPNCMVIDSNDEALKHKLVHDFSSELIRFYYGRDMIGNEIGAAAKNVIGIAAGMLDGLGLRTLKGALMSRGTREIARLIAGLGGNELSAYGLCHLGDYEATVFSEYSHNRKYGELFIQQKEYDQLAEGFYTVKALIALSENTHVELPICRAVYEVLYEKKDPKTTLLSLFSRSIKNEF